MFIQNGYGSKICYVLMRNLKNLILDSLNISFPEPASPPNKLRSSHPLELWI
jgi:hypothetical protein